MKDSTFWNRRPSATGRQLIMFPFLGGFGASYNQLIADLEGDWDIWTVNPPGHGPSRQPLSTNLDSLLTHYLTDLESILKPNAVFFGHSMGSVVAYYLLISMSEHPKFSHRMPHDLVLSGSCAPRYLPVTGSTELSDRDLVSHLMSFGGIPEEIAQDKSLIDMFLPSFRADYQVLEQAKMRPVGKLEVHPYLVFGGRDPQIPTDTPAAWQEYFSLPVKTHVLAEAEHMFVLHSTAELNRILNYLQSS